MAAISDIIPGSRAKILGTEPIVSNPNHKPIENQRRREKAPILTYLPLEEKIAIRSLWNHIGITYKGVMKKASEAKALQVVHDLVHEVAEYPTGSLNVLESLKGFRVSDLPSAEELEKMRNHHAPAIEIGRFMGALAIREGRQITRNSADLYYRAAELSDEEFPQYLSSAIASHQYRIKFWRQEFESVAGHPAINDLLYAIRFSHE